MALARARSITEEFEINVLQQQAVKEILFRAASLFFLRQIDKDDKKTLAQQIKSEIEALASAKKINLPSQLRHNLISLVRGLVDSLFLQRDQIFKTILLPTLVDAYQQTNKKKNFDEFFKDHLFRYARSFKLPANAALAFSVQGETKKLYQKVVDALGIKAETSGLISAIKFISNLLSSMTQTKLFSIILLNESQDHSYSSILQHELIFLLSVGLKFAVDTIESATNQLEEGTVAHLRTLKAPDINLHQVRVFDPNKLVAHATSYVFNTEGFSSKQMVADTDDDSNSDDEEDSADATASASAKDHESEKDHKSDLKPAAKTDEKSDDGFKAAAAAAAVNAGAAVAQKYAKREQQARAAVSPVDMKATVVEWIVPGGVMFCPTRTKIAINESDVRVMHFKRMKNARFYSFFNEQALRAQRLDEKSIEWTTYEKRLTNGKVSRAKKGDTGIKELVPPVLMKGVTYRFELKTVGTAFRLFGATISQAKAPEDGTSCFLVEFGMRISKGLH